jgi:hypothetical protein
MGSKELNRLYDLEIHINLITDVADQGWEVICSKGDNDKSFVYSEMRDKKLSWDGTIVAVVGLYDKGKTFVLNSLTK